MRALIYSSLLEIPAIAEDCGGRLYPSGSLGFGNNPEDPPVPYALLMQLPATEYTEVRFTASAVDRFFQIYVYDDRGDYGRIDNILGAVRETILGLESKEDTATGARCIGSIWSGESQDLLDAEHDVVFKYGMFKLASTK